MSKEVMESKMRQTNLFNKPRKKQDVMTVAEFKAMKKPSREKDFIESVFKKMKLKVIPEYKFVPGRKFRADWFILDKNILVEYEGLMSKKSRHTTVTGFTNDSTKYNYATVLGYRLLRYTALNYKNINEDLRQLICILQR